MMLLRYLLMCNVRLWPFFLSFKEDLDDDSAGSSSSLDSVPLTLPFALLTAKTKVYKSDYFI